MPTPQIRTALLFSTAFLALSLTACGGSDDSPNDTPSSTDDVTTPGTVIPPSVDVTTPNTMDPPASTRFESQMLGAAQEEVLVDSQTNLIWVNGNSGCLSPAMHGLIDHARSEELCADLSYAGSDNWRAPINEEMSGIITAVVADSAVMLNYINPMCPAMVTSDGFVQTENTDNAPGAILETASPAGVRCVTDNQFTSQFVGADEILVDKTNNTTWVNGNGGCISPAMVGAIDHARAQTLCEELEYAGKTDWRSPNNIEMSALIISSVNQGVTLNYLNAMCPAMVTTDGFVQTENTANPPGAILETANPAGVRCISDN